MLPDVSMTKELNKITLSCHFERGKKSNSLLFFDQ